jgi:glucosamine--fructose-6-phosphate aminotransferase (isomerizing)
MNHSDSRYARFGLVKDMLGTIDTVRNFDPFRTEPISHPIRYSAKVMLTGEGSSRIFPAKNCIRKVLRWGMDIQVVTEGSRQAAEYDLSKYAVFLSSNSGKTKEVITLAANLASKDHPYRYGITANQNTPLEKQCAVTFVLCCGWELAVAATKSVVEQALMYESVIRHIAGKPFNAAQCETLAGAVERALTIPIDKKIIDLLAAAPTLYVAGYNDGVAEEITLKTNEITRKKSDFLEGTYAVHGIEEVMDKKDVVIVIDPIDAEVEKFKDVLVQGVGCTVIAVADRPTPFPTVQVPAMGELNPYVYLCAGWNLLVETGLALGIDLDKPVRARKIGNEFMGK